MPTPVPPNATVTPTSTPYITSPVMNLTTQTTTTTTTQGGGGVITTVANQVGGSLGQSIGTTFSTVLNYKTVLAVVVLAILVVLIALFIQSRFGAIRTKSRNVHLLHYSLSSPDVDAIGIVLDLASEKATITPLRRIENLYTSLDPREQTIIVSTPEAPTWSLEGKPLIVAVGTGTTAFQVDPVSLTSLGLSKLAFGDLKEQWDDTINPRKSYEKIIEQLAEIVADKTGTIDVTPTKKLAFRMSPPRVVLAMLKQASSQTTMLATMIVEFSKWVDHIAERIRLHKAEEVKARTSLLSTIFIGIAIVIMIIGIVWYLLQRGGGG